MYFIIIIIVNKNNIQTESRIQNSIKRSQYFIYVILSCKNK